MKEGFGDFWDAVPLECPTVARCKLKACCLSTAVHLWFTYSIRVSKCVVCGNRRLWNPHLGLLLSQQRVAPVRTDVCSHLRIQMQTMEQQPPLGSARVVLWDPNGSNRFVVGGGAELKMYEWTHEVPHHYYYFSPGELIIQ
jgi:hypothetical protein